VARPSQPGAVAPTRGREAPARAAAQAGAARRYAAFVGGLEEASRDNLDFLKNKALRAAAELLRAKPEAEARLLAALVNKLGDPSRKLASKASAHGRRGGRGLAAGAKRAVLGAGAGQKL